MIRLFPLVFLIQVYCLYHAYTNRTEQKWIWIIFFFPLIGCIFYLYHHFYSRNKLEDITEEVKESLIPNYVLNKHEQKVKFSGTYANKMELGSQLLAAEDHDQAIEIFESCNEGIYKDDVHLIIKLVRSYFLKKDYTKVVDYGEQISGKKEFINSSSRIDFAWANYHLGEIDKAKRIFEDMDNSYSNYENRLAYCQFLEKAINVQSAKDKSEELLAEINDMDSYEKRLNKSIIKQIKQYSKELSSKN